MAELRAGHEQDGDGAAGQPLFARRNLLLGGLLLAGAGVAWARLPRQSEMRLGDAQLRAELVHQVQVRVEAEVARVLDHPVGPRLAELGDHLVATGVQRAVFRVVPACPEQ